MEAFVNLRKELLKEEHRAEIEECSSLKQTLSLVELQNRGICIRKLHIMSMKTGLYGRTIIKLGLRGANERPLPSHKFSSGDIVDLHLKQSENLSKPELQGVVTATKDISISVALDGEDVRSKADGIHASDNSLIMFKTANEVTNRRLMKGLDRLLHHSGVASPLIEVCFGETKPTSYSQKMTVAKYYNETLNESQKEAIEFALSQRELAVIHGPPGTGKTTTITELIRQLVTNGQKVLACAPSNVAIDNILEKLSGVKINKIGSSGSVLQQIKMVRLGHPARILSPELHKLSLDALIAQSDAAKIVQDVRKDIDSLYRKFRKKHNKHERFQMREEKKSLTKELREREKRAIAQILSTADVILATNVGAHSDGPLRHLPKDHFHVVVIDECAQALEASCWVPLLQAPKCILAGDHLQLPPTVKSHSAAAKALSKSLLERIVELHSDVVRMLNVQYRMNNAIMTWSSDNLYESKLTAHETVEGHLLTDLDGIEDNEEVLVPLLLIDTAGCNMPELQSVDSDSIGNPGEADLVAQHVRTLIESGMNPKDIAVISPYNMQVDLLRKLLHEECKGLEIRSVDGFQGREKEAVVLSLVRSNDKGIIGFLSDDRRTNVAVTRARRHLALICDSFTVGKHKFLKTLIDYMNEHGEVRSAHEFSSVSKDTGAHFDASAFIRDAEKWKTSKNSTKKKSVSGEKQDLSQIKIRLRQEIVDFVAKSKLEFGKKSYEFPPSLKPHERLVVHELCEEMNLKHESIGDGKDRRVIIAFKDKNVNGDNVSEIAKKVALEEDVYTKHQGDQNETDLVDEVCAASLLGEGTVNRCKPTAESFLSKCLDATKFSSQDVVSTCNENDQEKTVPAKKEVASLGSKTVQNHIQVNCPEDAHAPNIGGSLSKPIEEESESSNHNGQSEEVAGEILVPCRICGKNLPPVNIQLHELHCERLKSMKEKLKVTNVNNTTSKGKKKGKGKNKADKTRNVHEDDDSILDAAISANKICAKEYCKQSTTMLGQVCKFCKKTFCLEHHIPEVHGCGSAAHGVARQQICRDGVLYSGSGVPSKNLPHTKHVHLQRKLGSKLKEMEEKRKSLSKKK